MFGLFLVDRLDGAARPGGADPDRVVQLLARAPASPGAGAAMAVVASRSRCGRIWFRQLADGEKELPGLAVGPFGLYMQPVLSRDYRSGRRRDRDRVPTGP
jgi:hypothetical protein